MKKLPPALPAFSQKRWYSDFNDPRCPCNGALEAIEIADGSPKTAASSLGVTLISHVGKGLMIFRYHGVQAHNVPRYACDQGLGTWLRDEFAVTAHQTLQHRITWRQEGKGTQQWLIEAAGIEYLWRPKATNTDAGSASHSERILSTSPFVKPFADSAVANVFAAYPALVRPKLLALRELIFQIADSLPETGQIDEQLKWGQPSYLTNQTKAGSTLRIDALKSQAGRYAMYFHCQTDLISSFRKKYGALFLYEGNRALLFDSTVQPPKEQLAECIAAALTYHRKKRPARPPIGAQIR